MAAESKPNNDPFAFVPRPSIPTPNPFVFKTGDTRILITHNKERIEGEVSSHALCLASPVWEKFIFPPWNSNDAAETSDTAKPIDFSEDDSAALLTLFNIAHLRFHEVPACLPYKVLLQVAVLCDQYDCVNLVRPWLSETQWLKDSADEAVKTDQEQWLFIAWVFGLEDVFDQLATHLVQTIQVQGDGESWRSLTPMPPLIMESILSCRINLLASLLDIPYVLLNKYEAATDTIIHCIHRIGYCDLVIYASILRNLRLYALYPRLRPQDFAKTVNELAAVLESINIHQPPASDCLVHSSCCDTTFKSRVAEQLVNPSKPLLPFHHSHFQLLK
ncbi:uncharacterized protein LY89DRAFT_410943 [Mollisia scopiformis]|uniref:BTB domain-containing protein n=1 Tax=Mollisia scopiformis TaxID=149040 RepID=A0A132B1W7_MOLSC|nr:uncharacterized protein LY89DRAFT_410943 [Mollisia scopiformis]KUJ06372.1 hypothetical protein LY89DRAFT_410943 [Mollisia scopiformis]